MSKIWDIPFPYKSGPKNHLFWTTLQLNSNFSSLYLRKETRYRQSVKCIDNYKWSPISSQNIVNIGPQTASNLTAIFTHPMQILHPMSLPGFADGDQRTELNQTLPSGEW